MTESEYRIFKGRVRISQGETIIRDEYGLYATGVFEYKGMNIIVSIDDNKWHLWVSAESPLGYSQIKDVCYKFLPNDIQVVHQIPRSEEFDDLHRPCYHLWEI